MELKSIEKLRNDIKQSSDLHMGLIFTTGVFNQFEGKNPTKSASDDAIFKKFVTSNSFLQSDQEDQFKSINVLGFIKLYSDFEVFMYEFLVEMYYEFPESIPSDKKISISEILGFKSRQSIQSYIVDQIAISNSYDFNVWERTLSKCFGIELFDSEDDKKMLELLNLIRNMLMHSGGKANSKIYKEFVRLFGDAEEKEEFEASKLEWIYDDKSIGQLRHLLHIIIDKIETHFKEKNRAQQRL